VLAASALGGGEPRYGRRTALFRELTDEFARRSQIADALNALPGIQGPGLDEADRSIGHRRHWTKERASRLLARGEAEL
jgi:hypothetical protein